MKLKGHPSLNPEELKKTQTAIRYLQEHFTDPVSGYQLSEEVSLRHEKIQAGFRFLTGLAVHAYLIQYRIERAKVDLEDFSLSIKQIAARNGFSTSSWFIYHFKAHTKQTPGQYREQWIIRNRSLPPCA